MICAICDKKLMGGFKQPEGTFLCANCTIRKVEKITDGVVFQRILELCETYIGKGKLRANKTVLKQIASEARAVLKVRQI